MCQKATSEVEKYERKKKNKKIKESFENARLICLHINHFSLLLLARVKLCLNIHPSIHPSLTYEHHAAPVDLI
jgi:predicted protein tyrosine phosphatase